MAQHGYLREFDEGWDRGDDRDRGDRDWRERDERDWRGREEGWGDEDRSRDERDRNLMGGDRHRGRPEDRADERGMFERMGDEMHSRFRGQGQDWRERDEDRWSNQDRGRQGMSSYGREHGYGGYQGDYGGGRDQGGFGGRSDWERAPRNFSSHPDDHYRSWRDKQMQSLDSDYEDYCREREQQFHQNFDSWRSNRQGSSQGVGSQSSAGTESSTGGQNSSSNQSSSQAQTTRSRPASGQSGSGASGTSGTSEELLLDRKTAGTTTDAPQEPQATVDADSAATLGTTSGTSGRGRR